MTTDTTTEDTLPVFQCRAEWSRYSNMWLLVGKCPYCGQPHRHGGGTGKSPEFVNTDMRRSHCWNHSGGHYRLEEIK